MRILITGGCGFLGHHMVEGLLKDTDWEIVVLDGLTYAGDINKVVDAVGLNRRVRFVYHDLRSPISEIKHKQIGPINYCIHLAAESHVENSLNDPTPFAYNVVSTTNLLEYLKEKQEVSRYIGFNTDEVFGPAPLGTLFKETDKFYPSNPYSASKVGQWAMEYSFYKSFGFPVILTHCMNIFGERQHPEKFVPLAVRCLLSGQKIPIHGIKGHEVSSRKWIHAREVSNAALFILKNGRVGETYNINGEERDVLWVANQLSLGVTGRFLDEEDVEWINFHETRPGHDLRYALDGSKLKALGFVPKFTPEESFDRMVSWMIKPENRHWLNL